MEKKHNILYVDDVKWPPSSTIKMPYVIFWMGKEGVMEIFKKRRKSPGKLPITSKPATGATGCTSGEDV